jgi:hypothetical protein
VKERKTMPSQTNNQDTPRQQDDSSASKTAKGKRLNRLADEAAKRAGKREQRYDQEHNIFTK